jgi:hypothetical protein
LPALVCEDRCRFFIQERRTKMEKRDKKMPYEVVIQERKRVDLYGNVVYYIHWFDKYGYNITKVFNLGKNR